MLRKLCHAVPVRVLSLIHGSRNRSGLIGAVVRDEGHELIECDLTRDELPTPDYDALLTFGGAMHVDQDDRYDWLEWERRLLWRALSEERPVLGICLGAQLLAQAAGGTVRRLELPEVGWREVSLTSAAAQDPLFSALPARATVFQWHHYGFSLPPGATLLAENPSGCQAFRSGRAWGLQFHPEVTAALLEGWFDYGHRHHTAAAAGYDPTQLPEETERHVEDGVTLGEAVARRFLQLAA